MERDFRLLNGAHETFSIPMFRGLAHGGHAALDTESWQRLDVGGRGLLHALVGVMYVGPLLYQRPSQGRPCERLVQMTVPMPATHGTGLDLQQHGPYPKSSRQRHDGISPNQGLFGRSLTPPLH